MNYILAYDIHNDRTRKKISDLLIDKGFIRVQRSVFIGEISKHSLEKIIAMINVQLEIKIDSLLCFPINKEDYIRNYKFGDIPDYDFYQQDVVYM